MNDATKVRNWLADDAQNRDWAKLLLRLREKKALEFITNEEGRVIPIGGPSAGSGGAAAGGSALSQMANDLYAQAQQMEPDLTAFITDFVAENGGEMEGMDFRLKQPNSIESKIKRDADEMGVSHAEAAQGITDLVRYTAIFDADVLTDKASEMQKQLAAMGWERYDHKWRNYFGEKGNYRGYNTVYRDKYGRRFELQFHTPSSLAIKEQVHALYERARELPKGPERTRLDQQMQALWQGFQNPANYQNLAGEVMN